MIKRLILFTILFVCCGTAKSQLSQVWLRTYNGSASNSDEALSHSTDNAGNVYAAGKVFSVGSGFDIFVIKYDANGSVIWERTYNGPGNSKDIANSIALDHGGNVFVAGESAGKNTNADYVVIKYSNDGTEQWNRRYDGISNSMDVVKKMLLDDSGNVIVTGSSYELGYLFEIVTIKYSNSGTMLWKKTFSGEANGNDMADDLSIDIVGNIYVAANSFGSSTLSDFLLIKYNSQGDELWNRKYNGPLNGHDNFTSLVTDATGNIAITGTSVGSGTGADYATAKYSPSGDLLWLRRYTGPANSSPDEVRAIACDSTGNIFVSGSSVGVSTSYDYLTVKYSPSGDLLWERRYTGQTGNSFDEPTGICADAEGNVYVAGISDGPGSLSDIVILKYSSAGSLLWNTRYSSVVNGPDKPNKMTMDNIGGVLISGLVTGAGTGTDFAVLKYSQLTSVGTNTMLTPGGFTLSQNYPNPFNPYTTISFMLPFEGIVSLSVFDIEGKVVAHLINRTLSAGSHSLTFDANETAPELTSGSYFCRLNFTPTNSKQQFSNVRKMILIK